MISKENLEIPLLFLVFNRFETTKMVFERIIEAKPNRLYIASDGPRIGNLNDSKTVHQIREWLLENVTWNCKIETLFRQENMGCAKAVSSAIDWFFDQEEMGIILEDDCLPDPTFFEYCEELLFKYRDDTRIMHITGSNLLLENTVGNTSYYFSKYANVWGWASWRRAWLKYDLNIEKFVEFRKRKYLKNYFNYLPAYISRLKWYSAVLNVENEPSCLNTWDYQWCFTCVSNSGLSIVPKTNLIKNIGFGQDATHTNLVDDFFTQDSKNIQLPLKHPEFVMVDQTFDLHYETKIFGGRFSTYKMLLIDYLRKIFLRRRDTNYLNYL